MRYLLDMINDPSNRKYYEKLRADPERYEKLKEKYRIAAKKRYHAKTKAERRLEQSSPEFKAKRKSIRKKYRDKHPFWRLARSMRRKDINEDSRVTPPMLWSLYKKQRGKCALTGCQLTNENISCDHAVPRSRGGAETIDNIQLTTLQVNLSKRNMTNEEFLNLCKQVIDNSLKS